MIHNRLNFGGLPSILESPQLLPLVSSSILHPSQTIFYGDPHVGMIQEFKDFAMKGNVVDMAVGVVIGGAFGKIISALVEKVIMPLVGFMTGGVDFSSYDMTLKSADIALVDGKEVITTPAVNLGIGSFATVVIDFIIVAIAIFLAVKLMNSARQRFEKAKAAAPPPTPPEDVKLLREIRDALLKR